MSEPTDQTTDNLKSRVSRLFVQDNEFTDDNGKLVKYKRLVVQVTVKDEPFNIELKADKKDLAILALSDNVENATL